MSGRSLPAILGKVWGIPGIGHHPLFDSYGWPWNYHGARGCVAPVSFDLILHNPAHMLPTGSYLFYPMFPEPVFTFITLH